MPRRRLAGTDSLWLICDMHLFFLLSQIMTILYKRQHTTFFPKNQCQNFYRKRLPKGYVTKNKTAAANTIVAPPEVLP